MVRFSRIPIAPDDDPRWGQARSGDLAARNSLVEEHIRLLDQVAAVVCARLPSFADVEDIRSFGTFGLIKAVETYDPSIATFRTHAVFLIKARIYDELRSMDWAPKAVRSQIKAAEAARSKLLADGESGSDEAVAAAMGIEVGAVRSLAFEKQYAAVGSLDEALSGSWEAPPEDAVVVSEFLQSFRGWFDGLSEFDQAVWALRFYDRSTTREAAATLQVPVSRVSQASARIFDSFHSFVDTIRSSE